MRQRYHRMEEQKPRTELASKQDSAKKACH